MSGNLFDKMRKKIRNSPKTSTVSIVEEEDFLPPKIKNVEEEITEEEPDSDNQEDVDLTQEPQGYHVFFPKQDITTYDMARILALTQLLITDEMYEKYPPDLQKYFVKFNEIKPENNNNSPA